MATKDRRPTIRIRRIRRGDPIRADYLNQLADGANAALSGLDPPRSLRVRSKDDQINELQQGTGGQERIFTETERTTTTVRVTQEGDDSVWVDVERIDKISFQAGNEVLTLVLDWA